MKKIALLTNILVLYIMALIACGKSETLKPIRDLSSFKFSANDSALSYPINLAYIQDAGTIHTTLITGTYPDTSSKQGSISIRVISDTTGHFKGDSILVTYTDQKGVIYYNTHDSSNFVQIDKFTKTATGIVSGSFYCRVANPKDTLLFSKGVFTAFYQN